MGEQANAAKLATGEDRLFTTLLFQLFCRLEILQNKKLGLQTFLK